MNQTRQNTALSMFTFWNWKTDLKGTVNERRLDE